MAASLRARWPHVLLDDAHALSPLLLRSVRASCPSLHTYPTHMQHINRSPPRVPSTRTQAGARRDGAGLGHQGREHAPGHRRPLSGPGPLPPPPPPWPFTLPHQGTEVPPAAAPGGRWPFFFLCRRVGLPRPAPVALPLHAHARARGPSCCCLCCCWCRGRAAAAALPATDAVLARRAVVGPLGRGGAVSGAAAWARALREEGATAEAGSGGGGGRSWRSTSRRVGAGRARGGAAVCGGGPGAGVAGGGGGGRRAAGCVGFADVVCVCF